MVTVMGLDISTSTIGLGVLTSTDKIKLIHSEYFKPPKTGTIFERLHITKQWFLSKLTQFNPDEVAIEEFIQFMKHGSGAKTIIPLALFNRTIGLSYFEATNKEPNMLNVMSIRHSLKFDKQLPGKEMMPDIVAKHLNIDFPYIPASPKKKPKKSSSKDLIVQKANSLGVIIENFDVADGIAVALAYLKKPSRNKKIITKG